MPRRKYSIAQQISAAKACIAGEASIMEIARRFGVSRTGLKEWAARYQAGGETAFEITGKNQAYSDSKKQEAVQEYLSGKCSLREITAKYGLRSNSTLRAWIKVYNRGKDFGRKMTGGSRMKSTRQTTQEERIEIAKACLESGNNYGEIALNYNVSYQQARSWTLKYKELGPAGLEDRRGKRLVEQAPRTAEEEMRIRIAQLEHENYMLRVERDLLKKVRELEGWDASQK